MKQKYNIQIKIIYTNKIILIFKIKRGRDATWSWPELFMNNLIYEILL